VTPLELLAQLNWVDWAVILLVLAYAVAGVARGLLWGSLDLAGGVATLAVAALGYRYAADLIQRVADVPRMLATIVGFLALTVLAQIVYAALVHGLLGPRRPLPEPLATLDRALGAVPGLVKGALLVTFILLPFALFPLVPSVSAAIELSALASRMVAAVVATTPEVEALMGRDLGESLSSSARRRATRAWSCTSGRWAS